MIGLVLACFCIRNANALQLGDEMAKNLGIRVNASRIVLSGVSAFLAAATVSEVGMIGFVGLVAPHIARMLVGSDYKVLLPTSILTGKRDGTACRYSGKNNLAWYRRFRLAL